MADIVLLRKQHLQCLGFLFLVLISLWGCSATAPGDYDPSGTYHGEVYDMETGKPIEGAVVVVLWDKRPLLAMNGPEYLHKAVEGLTDAEGEFSIDAWRGIDLNPGTYVIRKPRLVIFKPGYAPFPDTHGYTPGRSSEEWSEIYDRLYAKEWVTIDLLPLKSRKKLMRFTSPHSLGFYSTVPSKRIPNVIRLINIQRKSLGFQPYTE